MVIALICLGIAALALLFLLIRQRRELRSITEQLREIAGQDSNRLLHREYGGAATDALINEINVFLKQLRRSKIDYQRKRHDLEQMMTNFSHDLRTPLTSALGYIGILVNPELSGGKREGKPSDSQAAEKEESPCVERAGEVLSAGGQAEDERNSDGERVRELQIVEKRLRRLEELIDSFFEFSRVISGVREPEKTNLNLTEILEEAIAHYYDDFCGQGREIQFDCPVRRIYIRSNRNMLMRIFDNLIGNACKHGAGSLRISAVESEGVRIRFENELEDSNLEVRRIFDEFYTTDISRTRGNTGLGLAIAKQFTEILGGRISADYRENLFSVTVEIF